MAGPRGLVAVMLALVLGPSAAAAQRNDDEWLRDCDEHGDDRLVSACDVRVERLPAPAGAIRVDPGNNGGVRVEAWTGNDIEVHTRIRGQAETAAEARQIAEAVRMVANGEIRADGPASDRYARWNVSFVVYVPASSDLDISTRNGPLSVHRVSGRMRLEAANGPLSLHETGGDVMIGHLVPTGWEIGYLYPCFEEIIRKLDSHCHEIVGTSSGSMWGRYSNAASATRRTAQRLATRWFLARRSRRSIREASHEGS